MDGWMDVALETGIMSVQETLTISLFNHLGFRMCLCSWGTFVLTVALRSHSRGCKKIRQHLTNTGENLQPSENQSWIFKEQGRHRETFLWLLHFIISIKFNRLKEKHFHFSFKSGNDSNGRFSLRWSESEPEKSSHSFIILLTMILKGYTWDCNHHSGTNLTFSYCVERCDIISRCLQQLQWNLVGWSERVLWVGHV